MHIGQRATEDIDQEFATRTLNVNYTISKDKADGDQRTSTDRYGDNNDGDDGDDGDSAQSDSTSDTEPRPTSDRESLSGETAGISGNGAKNTEDDTADRSTQHTSHLTEGLTSLPRLYPRLDIIEKAPAKDECIKELRDALQKIPGLEPYKDPTVSRVLDYFVSTVALLNIENQLLREEVRKAKEHVAVINNVEIARPPPIKVENGNDLVHLDVPAHETMHYVYCSEGHRNHYRDPPRLFKGDHIQNDHLRGLVATENIDKYLENNPKTVFVSCKVYKCDADTKQAAWRQAGYASGRMLKDSPPAKSFTTELTIGMAIKGAMKSVMKAHPERFQGYNTDVPLIYYYAPFILFYNHNKTFLELLDSSDLDTWGKSSLRLLCNWFEEEWRSNWDEGDELFARGKYNSKHYTKLFRPGELILITEEGLPTATKLVDYPWEDECKATVYASRWMFNGSFIEIKGHIEFHGRTTEEKDIKTLLWYPLRFAEPGTRDRLVARGAKFWDCRRKKLVSYCESTSNSGIGESERRVMVDYEMYRRLHSNKRIFIYEPDENDRKVTNMESPPDDDFLACLPPTIHGFDFSTKSWLQFRVDRITDVTWNKETFKQLVAPDDTKELIQAVVTAHGQQISASPDLIDGKGQGLLVLLHGCPGTGKTLTAESIAEEQERPLYRVTCGDIGIEPEAVEKYLGHVLEIGKAWGCVVLLDEADVFLEERSYADQKRNAIISIFLRVLEYYSGILILTTNRIGAFDEAFKSRIQVALSYPRLNEESRLKVWLNFVEMLRKTNERIDADDLDMNLHKLARIEMNGREIRNTITTARHLAKFRKEILRYKHMQDAVKAVQKFNSYLVEVKGLTDDEWARADKVR